MILNSYHPRYSWSDDILKGEFAAIRNSFPDCIFLVQYIDSKRFPNKNFLEISRESLEFKLHSFQPDVIIVNDNTAADFVFKYKDELFSDKPVVFCGFNGYECIKDELPDGVTGVAEEVYLSETVEMILKLHPGLKEIKILSSGMGMGPITDPEDFYLGPIGDFGDRVKISWHIHNNFDEIAECCGNSINKSVMLVGGFDSFEAGAFYSQDDVIELLSRISSIPVYSLFQTCNDSGVLGLGVVSGEQQGVEAGRIVGRILNGEKASDIKVVERVPWQPKFDSVQMKKWGVAKEDLPSNSIVMNEVAGFYEIYKRWIWLGGGLILLQSLIIVMPLPLNLWVKPRLVPVCRFNLRCIKSITPRDVLSLMMVY
ncbi:MAG: hypothetical protein PF904_16055, partial [Kiritimatiellae bacterium]|nr:hypothetical protein [Kiritimatiellia bacterium]